MEKQIKAGMTAHEALTILAARADAESGAGIMTAEEHDAITTITESPDRTPAAPEAVKAQLLAALEFCAKMLDDDGGRVQGKMYSNCLSPDDDNTTGIEYIRAAIEAAHARGLDEIADKTHAGQFGGFKEEGE